MPSIADLAATHPEHQLGHDRVESRQKACAQNVGGGTCGEHLAGIRMSNSVEEQRRHGSREGDAGESLVSSRAGDSAAGKQVAHDHDGNKGPEGDQHTTHGAPASSHVRSSESFPGPHSAGAASGSNVKHTEFMQ